MKIKYNDNYFYRIKNYKNTNWQYFQYIFSSIFFHAMIFFHGATSFFYFFKWRKIVAGVSNQASNRMNRGDLNPDRWKARAANTRKGFILFPRSLQVETSKEPTANRRLTVMSRFTGLGRNYAPHLRNPRMTPAVHRRPTRVGWTRSSSIRSPLTTCLVRQARGNYPPPSSLLVSLCICFYAFITLSMLHL